MNSNFLKMLVILSLGFSQNEENDNTLFNSDSTSIIDSLPSYSENTNEAKDVIDVPEYSFGVTGSVGFVNGAYITNTPVGGSLVITTPVGFKAGPLDLTLSLVIGSYNGEGDNEALNALLFGVGANATLAEFVFSETHFGNIGEGLGVRNFSGVSLEKLLKKGLNLPVNILVGGEGFIATKADNRTENSTYWGGLGVRLDYSF